MGAGHHWVKPGDWELGDHTTERCYFDSKQENVYKYANEKGC